MPISVATLADTHDITLLVNSAYRGESAKLGWTSESHLLEGQRIDDEMVLSYLQSENVTILKHTTDDVITGCVYLEIKGSELYLGMLTVSPSAQAKGIGKMLLNEAEAFGKKVNCEAVAITVITTRYELIAWYERWGFKATGEIRPFHVDERFGVARQPIELMVMEKSLL